MHLCSCALTFSGIKEELVVGFLLGVRSAARRGAGAGGGGRATALHHILRGWQRVIHVQRRRRWPGRHLRHAVLCLNQSKFIHSLWLLHDRSLPFPSSCRHSNPLRDSASASSKVIVGGFRNKQQLSSLLAPPRMSNSKSCAPSLAG